MTFTHDLAYEKGVDCINCHGDLIRGKGEVPRERCLACHNREGDLGRISDHVFMHAKHVTEHKIDCLQCHLPIEHSLDRHKLAHAAADCQSCHPNHHASSSTCSRARAGRRFPRKLNGMMAVRVECRTCHRVKEVSSDGNGAVAGLGRDVLCCATTRPR